MTCLNGNSSPTALLSKILSFLMLISGGSECYAAVFTQVNLSSVANTRIQNYQPSAAGYPEGPVTLGGVPFNIQAVGGNNAWNAEVIGGPLNILNIALNIPDATEAFSLINTFYGQPGPTSYVKVEFFGTGGAYFVKDLIGNVDVRDHFNAFWTNTINGTSTVTVYTSGGGFLQESRLDMQKYVLPASFLGQTLTSFRLTSTGGVGISDASIQGLTIQSQTSAVPEPASLSIFAIGSCCVLAGLRRQRRRQRLAAC